MRAQVHTEWVVASACMPHVLTALHRLSINRAIVVKRAASAGRRKGIEGVHDRRAEGEALLLLGLGLFPALARGQEGQELAELAFLGLRRLRPCRRGRPLALLSPGRRHGRLGTLLELRKPRGSTQV